VNWISIASNFASAACGAILGGMLTAYAIGRWRGEIEQKIAALVEWRTQIEDRLERGDNKLTDVPVLQSKIDESNRTLDRIREDVGDGIKELHTRISSTRKEIMAEFDGYVTRGECDRQHQPKRRTG